MTQHIDNSTTIDAPDEAGEQIAPCRLALTIAWHPNAKRVGEIVELDVSEGSRLELSRTTGLFRRLDGKTTPAPLADRTLSRRPFVVRVARDGGFEFSRDPDGGSLEVNGAAIQRTTFLTRERLLAGAVVTLSNRIVLVAHLLFDNIADAPELGLIGDAESMRQLRRDIQRLGNLDMSVFVRGEPGTGKALVGHAIHRTSGRTGPWIELDLAAHGSSAIGAHLFGDASKNLPGALRAAAGGTLLLKRAVELDDANQAKLADTLETGTLYPLHSAQPVAVSPRIIVTDDGAMTAAVGVGRFRVGLRDQLRGYTLNIPPLRTRREDIGRLFFHYLRATLSELDRLDRLEATDPKSQWLQPWLIDALLRHSWSGNVRELKNVAQTIAVSAADDETVRRDHVAQLELEPLRGPKSLIPASSERQRRLREIPDREILAALEQADFRIDKAAATLGLSKRDLYARIGKSGLFKSADNLQRIEIASTLKKYGNDSEKAAEVLGVSPEALRRHMKTLGI